MNPPCYRCESTAPLPAGMIGMCRQCSSEVEANRARQSATPHCTRCGHRFYNDWERIQHGVNQRHSYMAWTEEDRRQASEKDPRRAA